MAKSCCNDGGIDAILEAQRIISGGPPSAPVGADMVRMQFVGAQIGSIAFGGPGITPSGAVYRGGNNSVDKYKDVPDEDVAWLERTGVWERIRVKPEIALETPPKRVKLATKPQERKAGSDDEPVTAKPADAA